jgi:hypothetical protein
MHMKKVVLAAFVAGITLVSCSSEKDCECTTTTPGIPSSTVTTTIEDGECEDLESSTSAGGVTIATTCKEV